MTCNAREGVRIRAACARKTGRASFALEDRYDTRIDDLCPHSRTRRPVRWWGKVKGDLRPGGEFSFAIPDALEGSGRVDACDPPRQFLVTMRDEAPVPVSLARRSSRPS